MCRSVASSHRLGAEQTRHLPAGFRWYDSAFPLLRQDLLVTRVISQDGYSQKEEKRPCKERYQDEIYCGERQ